MDWDFNIPDAVFQAPMHGQQLVMDGSNCDDYLHGHNTPLYNYSARPTMSYFGPQPVPAGTNPELEALIDQYMRSVLRPEAFLPGHTQGSDLDSNPLIAASSVYGPASYALNNI